MPLLKPLLPRPADPGLTSPDPQLGPWGQWSHRPGWWGADGHCRESPGLSPGQLSPGGEQDLKGSPRRINLFLLAAQTRGSQEDAELNREIIGV